MPIRLNLLAEQQAAEDLRRRDPVKRAMWVAGLIVGVVAIWSGRLQIKLMAAMHVVNGYEAEWKKLEPEYKKVTANFDKAAEAERKWTALQSLASNRVLGRLNREQEHQRNSNHAHHTDQTHTKIAHIHRFCRRYDCGCDCWLMVRHRKSLP
jgi:hypothetical protein